MRLVDLLRLSLSALFQQKLRTVLTTLGVVFGSLVLMASLSVRTGVQHTVVEAFSRYHELRRISVYPDYKPRGEDKKPALPQSINPGRRQRLEKEIVRREQVESEPVVILDKKQVKALEGIEHVDRVSADFHAKVWAHLGNKVWPVDAVSAMPDQESVRKRITLGEPFPSGNSHRVLVSEFLLYKMGVVEDADLRAHLGKKIRLEIRAGNFSPKLLLSLLKGSYTRTNSEEDLLLARVIDVLPAALEKINLPEADKTRLKKLLDRHASIGGPPRTILAEEFIICGILGDLPEKDRGIDFWRYQNADVVLPSAVAMDLSFRLPGVQKNGLGNVFVMVDDMDHVKEVSEKVRTMGFGQNTMLPMIEREQFMYLLIFSAMTLVAVVALAVAAMGITNTMLMSVLERVREIGIMKAVGARNGHIQLIFLVEGAMIGLVGGLGGVLLAWAASFPGDAWVRSMVARRLSFEMKGSVFVFPPWLVIGVPVFACLVTTLAAYYPARRASRVDPVASLRHD